MATAKLFRRNNGSYVVSITGDKNLLDGDYDVVNCGTTKDNKCFIEFVVGVDIDNGEKLLSNCILGTPPCPCQLLRGNSSSQVVTEVNIPFDINKLKPSFAPVDGTNIGNRNSNLELSSNKPIEVTETTPNLQEVQGFPVVGTAQDGTHFHQDPVTGQIYRMTSQLHDMIPTILSNRSRMNQISRTKGRISFRCVDNVTKVRFYGVDGYQDGYYTVTDCANNGEKCIFSFIAGYQDDVPVIRTGEFDGTDPCPCSIVCRDNTNPNYRSDMSFTLTDIIKPDLSVVSIPLGDSGLIDLNPITDYVSFVDKNQEFYSNMGGVKEINNTNVVIPDVTQTTNDQMIKKENVLSPNLTYDNKFIIPINKFSTPIISQNVSMGKSLVVNLNKFGSFIPRINNSYVSKRVIDIPLNEFA